MNSVLRVAQTPGRPLLGNLEAEMNSAPFDERGGREERLLSNVPPQ
jgi:hypothetical protein